MVIKNCRNKKEIHINWKKMYYIIYKVIEHLFVIITDTLVSALNR
jgi:hypothetical protein